MKLSLNDSIKRSIEASFLELLFSTYIDIFIEKFEYSYSNERDVFNRLKVIISVDKCFGFYFDPRNIFRWEIFLREHSLMSGEGVVNLYSAINNIDRYNAIRDLSKIMDFDLDLCDVLNAHHGPRTHCNDNVFWSLPQSILIEGTVYSLSLTHIMYNFDNSMSGAIVVYSYCDDYFEFPVFVRDLGGNYGSALLLWSCFTFRSISNYISLCENLDSVVILCEDFILSNKINLIIHDSKKINYSNYILISFAYIEESCLEDSIKLLRNRNVVYVPNANRNFFENLKFINQIRDIAKSLKFQKDFIFLDNGSSKYRKLHLYDKFEEYMMNNSICIDEYGTDMVYDIVRTAVSYDEYLRWGKFVGIFDYLNIKDTNLFVDFNENFEFDLKITQPSINSILMSHGFTFIYGERYSSKSYFLMTILYAMASKFDVFDLCVVESKRILFVDFSILKDIFLNRLISIHFPYHKTKSFSSNFYVLLLSTLNIDHKFDLSSVYFQELVEEHIVKSQCDVVAFDNFPFSSDFGNKLVEKWEEVAEWFKQIKLKFNTNVVFCCDIKSDDLLFLNKIKNSNFSNMIKVQNINCSESVDCNYGSQDICSFQNEIPNGLSISITFEFLSNYSYLNNLILYFFKSSEDMSDSKWIKLVKSSSIESKSLKSRSKKQLYKDKVISFLKSQGKDYEFKRIEIDNLLNKKSGTSMAILKILIEDKLIFQIKSKHPRNVKYKYIG